MVSCNDFEEYRGDGDIAGAEGGGSGGVSRATSSIPVTPKVAIDAGRVAQIEAMLSNDLFCFGPKYTNRTEWGRVATEGKYTKAIAEADSYTKLNGQASLLPAWNPAWEDLYWNVSANNDSQTGKTMLMDRLRYLQVMLWAECVVNNGKYVNAINDVINKLISQPIWTYPTSYDRNRKVQNVDLASENIAAHLGMALYILDDKIDPVIRQRTIDTLYARVFDPMINSFSPVTSDNSWLTGINNWNPVCLSGVLLSALSVIDSKYERARFAYIAERYVQNYRVGFEDDGYCTEGMSYYCYGWAGYIMVREALYKVTNGAIDVFNNYSNFSKAALFPMKLQLYSDLAPNENYYAAIADCATNTRPTSRVMYYNTRTLGISVPAYANMKFYGSTYSLPEGILYVFPNTASQAGNGSGTYTFDPLRSYFEDAGVLTVRPADGTSYKMSATLKGGHNAEQHNHNDVGSYSIIVNNQFLVEDPGITPYTGDTFGSQRYTIKTINSYGHPVPRVADKLQKENVSAAAPVLTESFTAQQDVFALDLKGMYTPNLAGLTKLDRTFTYTRGTSPTLEVKDEFAMNDYGKFETAVITRGSVTVDNTAKTFTITREGESIIGRVVATKLINITTESVGGSGNEAAVPFTRIAVAFSSASNKTGSITITYSAQ